MKPRHLLATTIGLTLACLAQTAMAAETELERLKADNARLQAQVQQLQQACPVAGVSAAPPPAMSAPAAAAPMAAAPPPVLPPAAAAPVAPVAAPVAAAAPAVAAVTPPPGYKLVPVNAPDYIDPLAPPYAHTGCSRGVMEGPPALKWNEHDGANWDELSSGQSMAEVEQTLGKEHYDISARGQVQWQYGRCGTRADGFVLFEKGALVSWQKPAL